MSTTVKVLKIYAHSRDCNGVYVVDEAGNETALADGDYVPYGIGIGGGDSVELEIDVASGLIVGWDPEKFLRGLEPLLEALREEEDE